MSLAESREGRPEIPPRCRILKLDFAGLEMFECQKPPASRLEVCRILTCRLSSGRHACSDGAGQVAELLQHPDGAAGAATAHDVQGKHEASSAARGPDLHQLLILPPSFSFLFFKKPIYCVLLSSLPPSLSCDIPPPTNTSAEHAGEDAATQTFVYTHTHTHVLSISKSRSRPLTLPPITGALGGPDVTRQAESSVHTRYNHSNTVHLTNLFLLFVKNADCTIT